MRIRGGGVEWRERGLRDNYAKDETEIDLYPVPSGIPSYLFRGISGSLRKAHE